MAFDLVARMFEYGSVIRPYMNIEIQKMSTGLGLDERSLRILEFIGRQKETTFSQVAQHEQAGGGRGVSTSRISAAVSGLVAEQRYVKKDTNFDDQRQPLMSVTAEGRAALAKIEAVRKRVFKEIEQEMDLNGEEREILMKVFERGSRNFRQFLATKQEAENRRG